MAQKKYDYHTIVIGAGAGGLVVASGLAKTGKEVLLIEQSLLGGDCTHTGCIPSKSLIASAQHAHFLKSSYSKGLNYNITNFNADGALERVRFIIDKIAHGEDQATLIDKGIHVLRARATFIDPHTISCILANGNVRNVTAKFIVLATGSHPVIPKIDGLKYGSYLTNENIFALDKIPPHLAILGTGPIAIELGLAFSRLGSQVSIIGRSDRILAKEEPQAQKLIKEIMEEEGVNFYPNSIVTKFETHEEKKIIHLEGKEPIECSEFLIAIGRELNTQKLGLQNANVYYNENRVKIDRFGRTTQKNIFAVGDITGHGLFTHVAEHQGRGVLKSLMFWPLRFSINQKQLVPRVTFCDPEVASIGLTEKQALYIHGPFLIATYFIPFTKIDRAITQGEEKGFVKIITKRFSSKIIGATIVGPHSGEMLMSISLAILKGIPLRTFSKLIHPYPIYSLAIRKAADLYFTQTLFKLFKKS
ncbi:MAG: FAD-dependent oxidoreductase [Rhabdochlamydiaceae bacterium]|nr:FAD-dependent oxidoreductase [Candidatus Amphrikana amoebophyrae]